MKKPTHHIKQGNTAYLRCSQCSSQLHRVSVVGGSLFIECTICKTYCRYGFTELSKGSLTPLNADVPLYAQQQEQAVQVPATAPAAGHLSTETVDK